MKSIEEVLSDLGLLSTAGKKVKNELPILCPFHKEKTPSLFLNLCTGLFYCFGCKKKGNFKQFLEFIGQGAIEYAVKPDTFARDKLDREEYVLDESVLAYFQYLPEDLIKKGFKEEVLWNYKVGFHRERKRNIFPIRNMKGQLLGVSGGSIANGNPKYKVYRGSFVINGRKVESDYGLWFDETYPDYGIFDKSSCIWNLDRIYKEDYEFIIVVEGFKAALWLIQNGFPNTIALMGSNLTDEQKHYLLRLKGKLYLMLDNDVSGNKGVEICIKKLFDYFPLFHVEYTEKQPDDLNIETLSKSIDTAKQIRREKFLSLAEEKPNENDTNFQSYSRN